MKTIEIYTTPFCGYCHEAKRLLKAKNAAFTEFDVSGDPAKRREMQKRSQGGRTVPQIFIGDIHVGGFDEMNAMNRAGNLDSLLAA